MFPVNKAREVKPPTKKERALPLRDKNKLKKLQSVATIVILPMAARKKKGCHPLFPVLVETHSSAMPWT